MQIRVAPERPNTRSLARFRGSTSFNETVNYPLHQIFNRTVEQQPEDLDPDADELDELFQALANSTRRELLEQLAAGPSSVSDLAEPHDVSLAAVSKHLHVLEDAGLLEVEADGRVRRCRLNAAPLSAAFGWLTRYRIFWEDRLDALAIQLEDDDR